MANKKTTVSGNPNRLKVEETVERLPETEKIAIQEIEAQLTSGKFFRLANPNTQYTDSRSKWTLAGDQSKPLPINATTETYERIKSGFLVEGPSVIEFPEVVNSEGTD